MFSKTLAIATSVIVFSLATTAFAQTSRDIRQAQRGLQAVGLYRGHIDGRFGRGTSGAVKQYQAQKGLEQTGQLDATTLADLRQETSGARSAPSASPMESPTTQRPRENPGPTQPSPN